jgi:hypothetical protein
MSRVLVGRDAEWAGAAYDVLARALRPAAGTMAAPVPPVLAQIFPERGEPPATPDLAALAAGCARCWAAWPQGSHGGQPSDYPLATPRAKTDISHSSIAGARPNCMAAATT